MSWESIAAGAVIGGLIIAVWYGVRWVKNRPNK